MDSSFPGFVQCELADFSGTLYRFVEKVPVVSNRHLSGEDTYPQAGLIACCVINEFGADESGRMIVEIDTSVPWGVEATDGTTRFRVFADQLVELPDR